MRANVLASPPLVVLGVIVQREKAERFGNNVLRRPRMIVVAAIGRCVPRLVVTIAVAAKTVHAPITAIFVSDIVLVN